MTSRRILTILAVAVLLLGGGLVAARWSKARVGMQPQASTEIQPAPDEQPALRGPVVNDGARMAAPDDAAPPPLPDERAAAPVPNPIPPVALPVAARNTIPAPPANDATVAEHWEGYYFYSKTLEESLAERSNRVRFWFDAYRTADGRFAGRGAEINGYGKALYTGVLDARAGEVDFAKNYTHGAPSWEYRGKWSPERERFEGMWGGTQGGFVLYLRHLTEAEVLAMQFRTAVADAAPRNVEFTGAQPAATYRRFNGEAAPKVGLGDGAIVTTVMPPPDAPPLIQITPNITGATSTPRPGGLAPRQPAPSEPAPAAPADAFNGPAAPADGTTRKTVKPEREPKTLYIEDKVERLR